MITLVLFIGGVLTVWVLMQPRGWALYFPFWYVLFPKGFVLIDLPGLPVMTMYRWLCIWLFIVVGLRVLGREVKWFRSFPLLFPMILLVFSALASSVSNLNGSNAGFIAFFNLFNESIVPVASFTLVFTSLNARAQNNFFRNLLIFYALISLYAVVAFLLEFNPYVSFLESTTRTGRIVVQTYEGTLRGLRAQGTMSHPITFGAVLALVVVFFVATSSIKAKAFQPKSNILTSAVTVLSILVIIFAIALTKSRSPVLLILTAIFILVPISNFGRAIRAVIVIGLVGFLGMSFVPAVQNAVFATLNIFDSSIGEEQHGSSLEMRRIQLEISQYYLMNSPLFGNGMEATRNLILTGSAPQLYNSESIVFPLMIDQGIFGIFAYLFLLSSAVYIIIRETGSSEQNYRAAMLGAVFGYAVFVVATGVLDTLGIFLALYSASIIHARTVRRALE